MEDKYHIMHGTVFGERAGGMAHWRISLTTSGMAAAAAAAGQVESGWVLHSTNGQPEICKVVYSFLCQLQQGGLLAAHHVIVTVSISSSGGNCYLRSLFIRSRPWGLYLALWGPLVPLFNGAVWVKSVKVH